jgi:hypothetical protein
MLCQLNNNKQNVYDIQHIPQIVILYSHMKEHVTFAISVLQNKKYSKFVYIFQ